MKKTLSLFLTVIAVFLTGCSNEDETITNTAMQVSSETTAENAEITFTTLKIKGKIIADASAVTVRGVCWSTSASPTISDSKKEMSVNIFTAIIDDLSVNTTYYFRVYAINSDGEVMYSAEQNFTTLSLNDTSWKFTTVYPDANNFEIYSKVDFHSNNTTTFDEMDYPAHCPGCFITNGTWTVEGNEVTYIWEGSDPDASTYVYHGVVSGMTMTGSYTHSSESDGTWSAVQL